MQTVNKSLINQVLSTGILSDMLKFDKVMIHHYLKSIARYRPLLFFNDLKSIRDIFSLGRQDIFILRRFSKVLYITELEHIYD